MISYVLSFFVALFVSLLVYFIGSAVFHVEAVIAGVNMLGLFCFIVFLVIFFSGNTYFGRKVR